MRRCGVGLLALLALGSASCLRILFPDYECEDSCIPGTSQCGGNTTQFCILEPFFGCLDWMDDVNCDDRNATCIDAECVCAEGAVPCPPHSVCTWLASDPGNCGACGTVCEGECVGGVCQGPAPPGP